MMGSVAETTPHSNASVIGFTYLLYFLVAILGELLVPRRLVVVQETVNLVAFAIYIAVTLFLYGLFKPVNKDVSWLAAILSLLGSLVGILGLLAANSGRAHGLRGPLRTHLARSSAGGPDAAGGRRR